MQGVLYLTDTAEDQGGFQCVAGFHRLFDEWVKTQPKDRNPRQPDLAGLEVKSIAGKAGDLLIWHRLLAHGNGHNRSDKPRMAQYIAMLPASAELMNAMNGSTDGRRVVPRHAGPVIRETGNTHIRNQLC